MKSYFSFIFIILLFTALCEEEFSYDEDVMVLTESNFDSALTKFENIMVLFYAPWCGHCKKFHPEYRKAAITLKPEGLILAKCDATVNKKLSERFKIRGFPTTKLFIKGTPFDYNSGRTEKDVVKFMRKKTQPPTKPLENIEDLEKFIKENDVAIVYFGNDASQVDAFTKVARKIDDFSFATVVSEEIASKKEAKKGSVVLFKNFDEKRNDLITGLTDETNIEEFINKNSNPRVMDFSDKTLKVVFGQKVPGLFLYVKPNSEKEERLRNLMKIIADKYSGKLQVVVSDNKGTGGRVAEFLGVKNEDMPTIRLVDFRKGQNKYKFTDEITEGNILQFLKNWEENKLERYLKTEEEPEKNDEPVYKLVGKTFERDVLKSDKDVFVKFYAPWCGHCKKLAPLYVELAKKLKNNKKLLIAEIDATANEIETVRISGFPTLKLWPAGDKSKEIDYKGNRTVADMEKFLKEHVTNKLEINEEKTDKKTTDL
jgi:protein disulfide-isomerase A1